MTRVLLIHDTPIHIDRLSDALVAAGCDVVAELGSALALAAAVARYAPDMIIVDAASPSRDALAGLCVVSAESPRPIVMFTGERDPSVMRAAVKAGVSAYVVDGLAPERLVPVLDVAIARFDEEQRLRGELDAARRQLADRKWIDKAKGLLIEKRGLTEDAAYQLLRKSAMEQGLRVAEVARRLAEAAQLLS
ncbi:ANTAR domain-containing response regulator [Crenobacter cavernae]|uniref:ANTAR domain-containing protein n=1 Tax=Crenobacter cavernae TaxID=2290923 RepID=A0A345Y2M9_9NEIS|nr:ANTAR domain-containing protein [Crenobacter cavernae]AXK38181.1 ANTAR domain-containing protein [Crenobacter cavernae]